MTENQTQIFRAEIVKPTAFPTNEIYSRLGFSEAKTEVANEKLKELQSAFMNNVMTVNYDTKAKEFITDERRKSLELFPVRVLQKNGSSYYELSVGPNLKVITSTAESSLFIAPGAEIPCYNTEHVLMSGNAGNTIDLLSLLTGDKARNVFSFSAITPHFKPRRAYFKWFGDNVEIPRNKDNSEYGPDVLLTVPSDIKDGEEMWNSELFAFIVIHENGHAAYPEDVYATQLPIQGERNANSFGLRTIRMLDKQFPMDKFFDISDSRQIARKQMMDGYGGTRDVPTDNTDESLAEWKSKDEIAAIQALIKKRLGI